MKTATARGRAATRPAAMTVLATIGLGALLACAERPTAPPSAPALALASANRSEGDRVAGAAATLAWQKTARDLVASHKFAPNAATRIYALHSMALYAAVVAVGRGDDEAGGDGRAGYEAQRGAIAAASVQLLSSISEFADAVPGLEAQLAAYGSDASGKTHPQFTRGVAIGRAAGNIMSDWAKNDGYSLQWNESMRNAPGDGIWQGIPGTPPSGYQYPTVKPYFLTSQNQFRAPAPPAYLSARFNTDLAEVRAISQSRTAEQIRIANAWNLAAGTITTLGHWNEQAALYIDEQQFDERAASHLFALMDAAVLDATIGCWETKFLYLMLRPTMADSKNITTVYTLPNHPSYPSGHSCLSSAAATVLSQYFPAHAAQLQADVVEAGLSRIYGGIHYRFDIEAGQALGRSTAEWAMDYDRRFGVLSALNSGR
jgi:membrane-associated phospholipid phosphatase